MAESTVMEATKTPTITTNNQKSTPSNTQKFGNDKLYESPFDTYVFTPISEKLVDPCYNAGLTPNNITTISKIFEVMAIVLAIRMNYRLAGLMYVVGYIFDCVDGRLARKYKMCSNFGMMYDFNSDMITHFLLFFVLVAQNGFYFFHIIILLTMGYIGNIYYGLVRAIDSIRKIDSDNFYKQLEVQLRDEKPEWFVTMFLLFHRSAYDCYKSLFHTYDSVKAHRYMRALKYFGPGTFATLMTMILFFNLGAYFRYTLPQMLFLVDSMNSSFIVIVSIACAVFMYFRSGRDNKYIADNHIHYSGLIMGLIIIAASENNLTLSCGVTLLTFHLCYDIDCKIFRQNRNMASTSIFAPASAPASVSDNEGTRCKE